MKNKAEFLDIFNVFPLDLQNEIKRHALVKTIPKNTEILREGQYVKVVPLVINGLIKVFKSHNDKELLLYYIQKKESCIMSFSAGMKNSKSQVFAITEEETTAILLPTKMIVSWIKNYPEFNILFFNQFNTRYIDLLDTIGNVLFEKMDKRLYIYLLEMAKYTGQNPIKISHRQIAKELGTAREVISRLLKKLESEKKIIQQINGIKIL